MNIGIFYAGKTGTTDFCARELSTRLCAACFNLAVDKASPSDFDFVIIGSSVRMGRIHPLVRRFLKACAGELREKLYALFLVQGLPETFEMVLERNFSEDFLKKAVALESFGGKLDLEKQKGFSRLLVKGMMKNPAFKAPEIDWDAIADFVQAVRKNTEDKKETFR